MSFVDPHLIPKPRKVSRRGWVVVAVLGLLVAALYTLVAVVYNVEGGTKFTGDDSVATNGIITVVEPVTIDAQRNQATIHFTFTAIGAGVLDENERLTKNTRVLIQSATGTDEVRFPAGDVLAQKEITVGVDGEQAQYPFDTHLGSFSVMIDTYEKNAEGSFASTGSVYTTLAPGGGSDGWGVNGWDTTLDAQTTPAAALGTVTFTRAFSTKIFALLLLILVVLLAGIGLVVGVLVQTRRRRVEVGLMAYTASLLFALPLLRNYMPNAPPIGASIDIYVYLWVIVMATAAVTLVVTSWIGQTRETLLAERATAKAEAAALAAQTGD
jgi:hypothetical protein